MSDTKEISQTPASIPAVDGEWIITLNGRVLPEASQRLPAVDLPIGGEVTANTHLDGKPAVVEVRFGDDGVHDVQVHHQFGNCSYELTYELTRKESKDSGQRWTTDSFDPEATVEIVPPTEVDVL